MQTVYDYIINTLTMATFKITPEITVAELKEQFRNEVGGTLRIYSGRSEADDGAALVSLGAKEGVLECRTSRTVGSFEKAFQDELGLKVKVYTKDNWVKVLDGITLESASKLPNGMTKAKMEEYVSNYSKSGKAVNEEKAAEKEEEATAPAELVDSNIYIYPYKNKEGLYGYLDRDDNWRIEPKFEDAKFFADNSFAFAKKDGKYGVIDRGGNFIINPKFEDVGDFQRGDTLTYAKINGKFGFINREFVFVIQPIFDSIGYGGFKDGLCEVEINGKFGFIDETGNYAIQPIFDSVCDFSEEGLCRAEVNGKYGFIDKQGNFVIQPIFDRANNYWEEGMCEISIDGKCGFINTNGDIVIEPQDIWYPEGGFSEGLARVTVNDKGYGYINTTGKIVIEPIYDYANDFYDGEAEVELDGEEFHIDKGGNRID